MANKINRWCMKHPVLSTAIIGVATTAAGIAVEAAIISWQSRSIAARVVKLLA